MILSHQIRLPLSMHTEDIIVFSAPMLHEAFAGHTESTAQDTSVCEITCQFLIETESSKAHALDQLEVLLHSQAVLEIIVVLRWS